MQRYPINGGNRLTSWIVSVFLLLAHGLASGQVAMSSSKVTVIHEAATEAVPLKPGGFPTPPFARVDVEGDTQFTRSLSTYLVQIFKKAERPRLTESETPDFVIRAIIITPPELNILKASGGRFNPAAVAKSFGSIFGGSKMQQIPDNLNFDNTNMTVEARCGVEIRLLNAKKDIIGQQSVQVVRTNTLRALAIELAGVRTGNGAEDIAGFVRNLQRNAVQQGLVNLTAYHASTNLLVDVDKYILESSKTLVEAKEAKASSGNTADSVGGSPSPSGDAPGGKTESEWLTPAQAAVKLQLTEAEVIRALEKEDLKGRKFGGVWRIQVKDLQ